MKKGIIIYQSKYGATEKYARWLQEATDFPCIKIAKTNINEVSKYEIVVFCGGIYASGIAGIPFLKRNMSRLKDKKIVILCAACR